MPRSKKVESIGEELAVPSAKSAKKSRKGVSITSVGRRKRATASVLLTSGGSGVTVNNLSWDKYFSERPLTARKVLRPLEATNIADRFSVAARVQGGGKAGQIDAVALGIARAIVIFDPSLKPILRREGLITRDSREKERKKPGFLRARKKPQYSKR